MTCSTSQKDAKPRAVNREKPQDDAREDLTTNSYAKLSSLWITRPTSGIIAYKRWTFGEVCVPPYDTIKWHNGETVSP